MGLDFLDDLLDRFLLGDNHRMGPPFTRRALPGVNDRCSRTGFPAAGCP